MKKSILILVLLFFGCETETGNITDQKFRNENSKSFSFGLPLPDPLATGPYSVSSPKDYTWRFSSNEEYFRGRYIYPLNKLGKSDLVIIVHGNFTNSPYKTYTKLQNHLASHGYITASIQWDSWGYASESKQNDFGALLIKNLNFLYNYYYRSIDKLTNDVVLVGHSRGGMAIIQHAGKVKSFGKTLKAIISAAPSPQSYHDNKNYSLYNQSKSILFLYGSGDEDVIGSGSPGNYRSAFKLYDRASTEGTTQSGFYPNKDMIYFKDAYHKLFKNSQFPNKFQDAAIAYTLAYIKHYSSGVTSYGAFFKFQKRFPSLDNSIELFQQHADNYKRVVANFQNNNKYINSMGGNISYHSDVISYVNDAWSSDSGSPHKTKILRLYWNKKGASPYVRFYIPSNYRKWSNYKYLSFRIQQRRNSYYNTVNQNQDFNVRLKDLSGSYQDIRVSKYGRVPYILKHSGVSLTGDSSPLDGGMNSILIPLSAFDRLDLDNITRAGFRFNISGYEKGSVIVDNIELFK